MAVKEKEVIKKIAQRASRPTQPDTQKPLRSDVQPQPQVITESLPRQQTWLQKHLVHIGLGMLIAFCLYLSIIWYVVPFVLSAIDQVHCGESRICHYDFPVGHGGTSHFLTQYWHNQVILIEMPNGDPAQAKVYSAKVSAIGDSSQHIVSLTPSYQGRRPMQGKPDLIASMRGFAIPVIFYNTGTGFSTEEQR